MPLRPDIDALWDHVTAYVRRAPYASLRHEHAVAMIGGVPTAYGLDIAGLFDEVHRLGHFFSMATFLDEAFLAGEHGPERLNPIDDYLRRRGWQETPRAREYLQGIRDTPPTLFEVQDVGYGEWVDVRDRFRGGPTRRVVEYSGSRTLQRWDCILGRVVMPRGEPMFTGGMLSLTRGMATGVEDIYRRVSDGDRESAASGGDESGFTPDSTDRLCLHAWLRGLLDAARRPLPALHNTDGDPLVLARTRLQVAPGSEAEACARLDRIKGWHRESNVGSVWTWLAIRKAVPRTVRATARLERGALVVETNSRRRMEQALALLGETLGDLVTATPTVYEDPLRASLGHSDEHRRAPDTGSELQPAEVVAAMADAVRNAKDAHYRRTLGERIPMLGNRTPRQCRRSAQGRALLLNWLKELENQELRAARGQGTPPYDLRWLWEELGVEPE